jgi:F-type H+-transporting ATPase subunit epsilon
MADEPLQVELVSADSKVWSGEASFVLARTTDGELGVLPDHAPLLSVLVESVVLIRGDGGGEAQVAAVDGGFISVANNRVSILAEHAQLSEDIDAGQARQDIERAQGESDDDEDAARLVRWAEARIAATERSG